MTEMVFQWPYTVTGNVWLFRKFDCSVLVCEGKLHTDYYGKPSHFDKMLEVSCYDEYNEAEDRVVMRWDKYDKTPYHYQRRRNFWDSCADWVSKPLSFISKTALDLAQTALWTHIYEYVPAMILKGKSTVYGQQMIRESNFHKFPEHFRCDLYHRDFYRIGVEEPTSFAWVLYRAGTNLLLHSNNVDMYIKHRMSQGDKPKYYWAAMGILAQRDPMDVHTQAMTYLPRYEESK